MFLSSPEQRHCVTQRRESLTLHRKSKPSRKMATQCPLNSRQCQLKTSLLLYVARKGLCKQGSAGSGLHLQASNRGPLTGRIQAKAGPICQPTNRLSARERGLCGDSHSRSRADASPGREAAGPPAGVATDTDISKENPSSRQH